MVGVQPGGDVVNGQRQYTQRVPLLQSSWNADPVVTLQGGVAAGRLTQGTDIAARAPLNGARQLQLQNAPLVFAGYGVFAAAMRTQVVERPRVVVWMRRIFAGSYAALAGRLALPER